MLSKTKKPTFNKFTGCVLGQCVGDALGVPVEGSIPSLAVLYVRKAVKPWLSGTREIYPEIGQYTDDSQLMRLLVESYCEHADFSPEDYAQRIADIFTEDRIVGRGLTTEEAAYRLANGVPWDQAAGDRRIPSNGSAMRTAPVGLRRWNNMQLLKEEAVMQSRITHAHPHCLTGSVIVSKAIALALTRKSVEPLRWLNELVNSIYEMDLEFAELLDNLKSKLENDPADVAEWVKTTSNRESWNCQWEGISPNVLETVLWSLYSFFRHSDSYTDMICCVIDAGGDTDTTAAITGAIGGAYLGIDKIPENILDKVHDKNSWEKDDLICLTKKLWEIST